MGQPPSRQPGESADKRDVGRGRTTPRPPPNVKPGTTIGDKYRVERELGRGGFGVVVRAIHLTLDQRVAIKVLTEGDESTTDEEFEEDAARFRREAKATAALKSNNVVRVLDVDVLDSGYPYIVMEYLEGRTLHELVYSKNNVPIEEMVDYAIQVIAALAEAHSVGIVHRDLKPANVFLAKGVGGTTVAKVLDFGVSKLAGASQKLTRTGAVVGTVAYMAPEQMLDAKRVDGRADLWSLGLVLYEALAKKHPFGASSAGAQVVTAIINDPVTPIRSVRPDVPVGLDAVLSRLLEKDPERRFSTARRVAEELAPFGSIRSRPVLDEIRRTPQPTGDAAPTAQAFPRASLPPKKKRKKKRGIRTAVGILLALLTAILIVGIVFVWKVRPDLLYKH